jgi:hypothetical protein
MTKLRQMSRFELKSALDGQPVEQYVTALSAASCVVATLCAEDSSVLSYQVLDHYGQPLNEPTSNLPAGRWTQPTTSYEQSFQWGVLKKAPGLRRLTRVDEWVRPLSFVEKMALIDAFQLPPWAMLGLAYSQPLYEVMLDERWILREVGLAHTATGSDYDYVIRPLRLLHPVDEDTLFSPSLDGVRLKHPTAPIRHQSVLVVTDLSDPPAAWLWQVIDA